MPGRKPKPGTKAAAKRTPPPWTEAAGRAPDSYDPRRVEETWQAKWRALGLPTLDLDRAAHPYYNLMMFPYPSAEGLHVGNVYAFTGADIHGRYRRLAGLDVFEPIGFDAFGIHSENFALQKKLHPRDLIPKNVANFTRQLKRMGFDYDWTRTVDTTDPRYYKWTQWIFVELFRAGLAERREAPVNYCPSCKTVLANEQVIDGRCERCQTQVTQRILKQWFFKITQYAERLLKNLDRIDWSPTTLRLQRSWIGRSEGVDIDFAVQGQKATIRTFTTRPDTLFGVTFLALAPEHPLVAALTAPDRRAEVEGYIRDTAALDLVERQKAGQAKRKTGVPTGARAVNPATGEAVPIWVADYVLMQYGQGAIMGVPAHDERDREFAEVHGLPVRQVLTEPGPGSTADPVMIHSGRFDGLPSEAGKAAVRAWLEESSQGEGRVRYRLHDWCVSRQRYWGPPIPIVDCGRCGTVAVPVEKLPVLLPDIDDFTPDESGRSPLARSKEFLHTDCPQCGGPATRETDVSDTFLDSAWYFLRYPSTEFDDRLFDAGRTKRWLPVDMYIGGEEHAVLHLMYARFITMALHDLGHLPFEEPFKKFRKHGLIIKDGAKMSKSRGNVVIPDQYIETYGADALRAYLMFLGPYEEGGDFRDAGIAGLHRFLHRVWDAVVPVEALGDGPPEPGAIETKLHATIRKVTSDIESLGYNTAIAALMEYLNVIRASSRRPRRSEVEPLVVMVAPFAPHLAEELWARLGHAESLFQGAHWPRFDAAKVARSTVEIVVQVDGKPRGTVTLDRGAAQETVLEKARAEEKVKRHLEGRRVARVVFVPDRLINIVTAQL